MKVYVVSYFTKGEFNATDGVYGVYSSLLNALRAIDYYAETFNEDIIDFSNDSATSVVYTTKGMYLIEPMDIDEDC